jgi:hypothetical protein
MLPATAFPVIDEIVELAEQNFVNKASRMLQAMEKLRHEKKKPEPVEPAE